MEPAHYRDDLVRQIAQAIVCLNQSKKQHPMLISTKSSFRFDAHRMAQQIDDRVFSFEHLSRISLGDERKFLSKSQPKGRLKQDGRFEANAPARILLTHCSMNALTSLAAEFSGPFG
jgi:hypothetical protein